MLREVRYLRQLGLEIQVASIRKPDRDPGAMTVAEREEAKAASYVKSAGLARLAAAHARTLATRPGSYIRGLVGALRSLHSLFYFAEAVAVGDWMRRQGLTHVHTHYASAVGEMVPRIFPVTLSITFHGPAEFQDPVGWRLVEKVQASLFCCAISQYGVSQLMYACDYAEWPKMELTLLGVDPNEFAARPFRAMPAPFQIICVGRLAAVKGQHVLIAATAALAKQGRQVRLRFVGDGPDRAALVRDVEERCLAEHVSFEGNVNQDKLMEMYQESDVLALSSFAEGLPVVLMEAMAMEIPCVAPWVNGIPEIITHGSDGLLTPPGDAEALAGAIARLMDDADLRRTLGEKARVKVLEKFDLRRNTERLAGVFERRLSG